MGVQRLKRLIAKLSKTESSFTSPIMFEPLEPRVLFSAALPVAAIDNLAAGPEYQCAIIYEANIEANVLLNESLNTSMQNRGDLEILLEANQHLPLQSIEIAKETSANELVIVDTSVSGFQNFLDEIISDDNDGRRFEVVTINSDRNGIEQISNILSGHEDLDAVHIISHGVGGQIKLGDISLNLSTLDNYKNQIAQWADSLSADADLLFYGCNVAGNSQGQELLTSLAELTGSDVAASTDLTGAINSGGDWDLEFTSGAIETDSLAFESYEGSLAAPTISNVDGDSVAFTEDGGAIAIDDGANATVDDDGDDYNGGYLLVNRQANFTANDTLSVGDIGLITLVGSDVKYSGTTFGTVDGTKDGTGSNDLQINLNASSDDTNVGALIQAITFNNSSEAPDATSRTARVTLNDSAMTSDDNDITISITPVNDNDPVITSDGGGATANATEVITNWDLNDSESNINPWNAVGNGGFVDYSGDNYFRAYGYLVEGDQADPITNDWSDLYMLTGASLGTFQANTVYTMNVEWRDAQDLAGTALKLYLFSVEDQASDECLTTIDTAVTYNVWQTATITLDTAANPEYVGDTIGILVRHGTTTHSAWLDINSVSLTRSIDENQTAVTTVTAREPDSRYNCNSDRCRRYRSDIQSERRSGRGQIQYRHRHRSTDLPGRTGLRDPDRCRRR